MWTKIDNFKYPAKKIKHATKKTGNNFYLYIFLKRRFDFEWCSTVTTDRLWLCQIPPAQASTAQCKDDQESFESSEADLASAVVGLESAISKVTATKAVEREGLGPGEVDWKLLNECGMMLGGFFWWEGTLMVTSEWTTRTDFRPISGWRISPTWLVAGRLDAAGSLAEEFGFGRSLGLCPNAKEGSNLGFVTGAMAWRGTAGTAGFSWRLWIWIWRFFKRHWIVRSIWWRWKLLRSGGFEWTHVSKIAVV